MNEIGADLCLMLAGAVSTIVVEARIRIERRGVEVDEEPHSGD